MRRLSIVGLTVAMLAFLSSAAVAQAPKTAPPDPGIGKLLSAMEDRFSRGDAKGLAALWTPDGDFVGSRGERLSGRAEIEQGFRGVIVDGPKRELHIHVVETRLLKNDVALVDAMVEVTPPIAEFGASQASLVLVRQDGKWLIESARESAGPQPEAEKHLRALEWIVGEWEQEGPAARANSLHSSCDWTANHSFLIRKFTSLGKDGHPLAGTEIIAWDPRARRIRSWIFDSRGVFGENVWMRDGKRWTIIHTGVLADGSDVSATHVLTLLDANTLKVEFKDRIVNGQRQPDAPTITVKRLPLADGAKGPSAEKHAPPAGLPK